MPLGKLPIREVTTWENNHGKLPLRKMSLGKYLTSINEPETESHHHHEPNPLSGPDPEPDPEKAEQGLTNSISLQMLNAIKFELENM